MEKAPMFFDGQVQLSLGSSINEAGMFGMWKNQCSFQLGSI